MSDTKKCPDCGTELLDTWWCPDEHHPMDSCALCDKRLKCYKKKEIRYCEMCEYREDR
jgi:hypothetical protein